MSLVSPKFHNHVFYINFAPSKFFIIALSFAFFHFSGVLIIKFVGRKSLVSKKELGMMKIVPMMRNNSYDAE